MRPIARRCSSAGFFIASGRSRGCHAGPSHPTWRRLAPSAVACLPASNRASALARMSDCSDCSAHCFFYCLPLFPRRQPFPRPRKALHCNWRAFSIADRLYFAKIFFPANRLYFRPIPSRLVRRCVRLPEEADRYLGQPDPRHRDLDRGDGHSARAPLKGGKQRKCDRLVPNFRADRLASEASRVRVSRRNSPHPDPRPRKSGLPARLAHY
jgi:hypothetical protein